MSDAAIDGDTAVSITAESSEALESKIVSALHSREGYLKEQANSLSMIKVRRLLENDLGMEKFTLDAHKSFLKQQVFKILGITGDGEDNSLKAETVNNDASIGEGITADTVDEDQLKNELESPNIVKDNSTNDTLAQGLVSGYEKTEQRIKDAQNDEGIDEGVVKATLLKRADYFRANLDNITLAGVRRLLEDDLKLERYSLDPFKKFISRELDEIIKPPPVSTSKVDKRKILKTVVPKKASKTASKTVSNEESESSDGKNVESSEEENASSRKRVASKAKASKKQSLEKLKKRKIATNETKNSRKKSKLQEKLNNNAEVDHDSPDSDDSPSPAVKNKVMTPPTYGKRVEQLKSVIKSCGIRVPPVIYKRAKQAPENKQEAALIKELEAILSKEGLSANPSEKEIKDVKKRKEKERELEGIDMSNIVSSSRRRSTSNFVAPVKPVLPVESDVSQSEDEDDDEEGSDSDGNDDIKDEIDENDDLNDKVDDTDDDETKNSSGSENDLKEGKDEDSD